ncbi:uncharacterized protein LOC115623190 [Scaptodrosophila lebanonensis]|uniref:Uncharacterized protein LOC115623190 n=1 Tax=Drosophila lebanonensis TaxID=7225 RepID=A0A6J2TDS5_DROLE|nr:uncharacterized protein LOC115623190 [Scaptodrosophila lebanonensis]
MQPLSEFWSRSLPVRKSQDCNNIFHNPPERIYFYASFEKKHEDPPMGLLLGWEFGRQWLEERQHFLREKRIMAKENYIEPDFNWWLNKRKRIKQRKNFQKKPQPPGKTCNITAFTKAKEARRIREEERQKRLAGWSAASGEVDNKVECKCKTYRDRSTKK